MKKIISLLVVVAFVISFAYLLTPKTNPMSETDNPTLNLCSAVYLSSELEKKSIDIENSDEYDVCVLIEAKDDLSSNDFVLYSSKNELDANNVNDMLKRHREKVKNYYYPLNEEVANFLGLNEYSYFSSFYSPYIELVFDNLCEYDYHIEKIIESVIKNKNLVVSVSSYAIIEGSNAEANIDDSTYNKNYSLNEAFDDIGVLDSTFTGDGVNVGVIDLGVPEEMNLKPGKYTMIDTTTNNHSTVITSIIGGTSGIAGDVHFYCTINDPYLVNHCNMLIDTYNVNIINVSLGYAIVGYYTNYDSCIDHIVSTTGCTYVTTSGNDGELTRLISAPGCAMNAITVGSINYDYNVSSFSSWDVVDSFLYKPDVVAPGERLYDIPNLNNGDKGHSGTSYAAPMVVGTLALLMEEFPILKINPALVKSVLHLGAEKLPSQTNYYDEQAGFGMVNYQNMRNCLLSTNYSNFAMSTTAVEGDTVLSYPITLSYLDQIFINANSIVNSSNQVASNTRTTPQYTDYSIKIYNLKTSTYVATSIANSSVDYLSFTNEDSSNTSFRIDIVLETDSASNETEFGAMAYELIPHVHSYTQNCEQYSVSQHKVYCECGEYVLQNHVFKNNECFLCGEAHTHDYIDHYLPKTNSTHISYCACGNTSIEPHVVSIGAFSNGNKYAICLVCGGTATTGITLHQGIGALPRSENGSFILPNGIIVLADEDMEAYFSGTLEFAYPYGNLETE